MTGKCAYCEQQIEVWGGAHPKKYCSDACKQAAYRRSKDPLIGSEGRKTARIRASVETKAMTLKNVVCACCGKEFSRSISETNLMYCSFACRQRAYRDRKKLQVAELR